MWEMSPWITRLVKNLWLDSSQLWQDRWIQFLVVLSLFGRTFLVLLGRSRKHLTSWFIQFLIWAAYVLSMNVTTIALSKLTTLPLDEDSTKMVLLGLLAPVLLMHLGNPDNITAFSIEELHLGLRQIVSIVGSVVMVVWVLYRCWDKHEKVSWLFIPLFLAGATTTGGWVWGLNSVFGRNSNVTFQDLDFYDEKVSFSNEEKDKGWNKLSEPAKIILRAFYRFDCLKPHIPDWPYHPIFVTLEHAKIKEENADEVFQATEIELSFMYDTLYTRAPILYTWLGMTGCTFKVCCIALVVWIFSAIYNDVHWGRNNPGYTFVILVAVLTYELYQTVQIPFSDWAVVKMIRLRHIRIMWPIIDFVAKIRISQKKWSGTMGQLNLFEYSHRAVFWKPVEKLLLLFKIEEVCKKHWIFERVEIPKFFKGMLLRYMNKFEEKRKEQPFTMRGDWTFEIYQIPKGVALSSSIEQGFDKSIITWHIATEICLHLLNIYEREDSDRRFLKMISDYMMYLAALRPKLLSLRTTDITVRYARKKIPTLTDRSLRSFEDVRPDGLQSIEIEDGSSQEIDDRETQKSNDSETLEMDKTIITSKWDVLSDARKLAKELQDLGDKKWEVMGSIWTEMLCYAAYNCDVYHHSKTLWFGGELITHVWLILLHKTDKYRIKDKNDALNTLLKQKKKKGLKTFLCF